jgi:hypothetical protein
MLFVLRTSLNWARKCDAGDRAILIRVTVPPVRMGEPGPDDATLGRKLEPPPRTGSRQALPLAIPRRARGGRSAGELFRPGSSAERPETATARSEAAHAPSGHPEHRGDRPDRSRHEKIPAWEQQASAACAVHNLHLAAHALGFGAVGHRRLCASRLVQDGSASFRTRSDVRHSQIGRPWCRSRCRRGRAGGQRRGLAMRGPGP